MFFRSQSIILNSDRSTHAKNFQKRKHKIIAAKIEPLRVSFTVTYNDPFLFLSHPIHFSSFPCFLLSLLSKDTIPNKRTSRCRLRTSRIKFSTRLNVRFPSHVFSNRRGKEVSAKIVRIVTSK